MGYYSTGKNNWNDEKVVKMEAKLNIYQRINAVQKEISYLQKDKKVDTGGGRGYFALTHDKLVGELRGLLVKHGIVTIPRIVSEHLDRHVNPDGRVSYFTQVRGTIQLQNIDDKNDFCIVEAIGYGTDTQDKGAGKALSYFAKYAMLKTFMIESGDDEEDRPIENLPQALKQKTQATKNSNEYRYPWGPHKGKTISEMGGLAEARKYYANLMKRDGSSTNPDMKKMKDAIDQEDGPIFTAEDIPFIGPAD